MGRFVRAARRHSRRRFLREGLVLAGSGLLAGCQLPRLPWQAERIPRIGYLAVGSRTGARAAMVEGLLDGLREHGYEEGRNITFEYRFSDGRDERLPELAAELVALQVDLIVASGSPASFAAAEATRTIPIVMGSLAADPIATGLIRSLARPGGNVTGMTDMASQLAVKWLELLKELVPGLARVAAFWNPANPSYDAAWRELGAAASTLAVELVRLVVSVPADFAGAFDDATRQRAGALVMPADPLVLNNVGIVAGLALGHRLPATYSLRQFPDAGGLLSYGSNVIDSYRRAAKYVDRILKGANPAELPMEQPTKFDFVLNAKTAQALGLTIPPAVLEQATEVIQ